MKKLSTIKLNPKNPRLIKDAKFKKLCESIKKDSKFLELRPIIIDKDNIILGGNMRFRALKELGYKEVPNNWIKKATDLTKAERERFIVRDNIEFGEFDFDMLANDFEFEDLKEWGFEEWELGVDYKVPIEFNTLGEFIKKNTDIFGVTFYFKNELKPKFDKYVKEHSKEKLRKILEAKIDKCG